MCKGVRRESGVTGNLLGEQAGRGRGGETCCSPPAGPEDVSVAEGAKSSMSSRASSDSGIYAGRSSFEVGVLGFVRQSWICRQAL